MNITRRFSLTALLGAVAIGVTFSSTAIEEKKLSTSPAPDTSA